MNLLETIWLMVYEPEFRRLITYLPYLSAGQLT